MTTPPAVTSRRAELRELWKLALPIAIAQAGQSLMGFVDTAVLARAGLAELAAVAFSNAIFFLVSGFGAGMMMGLDPLVSQAFGAGNESRTRALLWQGSYLAVVAGILLALPMVVGIHLLPHFGVRFVELPQMQEYITWRAPGLPLLLLFITARAYLQGVGRTGALVVATVAANVLNLAADLLLVFGGAGLPELFGPLRAVPALGARGAALSTTLCCALQWAIVALAVRRVPVSGEPPSRRPQWANILQALWIGIPIGVQVVAEEGIHAVTSLLARSLGPESISAHQIAISYCILSFTVAAGIGNAGSVRVGWAVGAGNLQQVRQSGRVALASGAAFMACSALLFALFPQSLVRLIGAPPEVEPLLIPLLMVAAVFQLSDGVLGVGAGVLRGMGETRFTSAAVMAGQYLVGLPVALLLAYGLGYGVMGLWGGLCMGLAVVALALLWRFERLCSGPLQPLQA
ncbi:MATE family efflux transporter [Archangium minus]|uniref:Multidrug-efflux transporter n=1 Tax=Archangium minus TaxID=83450 RepID=A0ABY9X2J5_9BACT|nr:MATE family efflux transporter [Archangium minus]